MWNTKRINLKLKVKFVKQIGMVPYSHGPLPWHHRNLENRVRHQSNASCNIVGSKEEKWYFRFEDLQYMRKIIILRYL